MASERLLLLVVALGGVAASATVAGATHVRAKEQGEPTLAFDCAPPHPGPPRSLGDTLCVGTADWRRRFRTLAAMRSSGTAVFPSWSPDGQRLLFRIALSRGNSQLDDIGMINLHDSDFVDLSNQPARPTWGAEWSPDGRRIVFNRAIPGRPGMRLFVMNADGSRLRQITRIWGEYPAWSPDGQLIAFMSNRCACNGPEGAEYDVYTVRPDGLRLHRLTSWPGEEAVGGWSPDGRELAYGRNPDQHPGIWLIPREGGTARHLEPRALGVQLRGSTWEPDGSFLANAIRAGVDPQATSELFVYRVSPDGQSATLLLRDADGARLRPSGAGRMSTRLTLRHRWLLRGSTLRLELLGHLSVAGNGAARSLTLGRLGALLPTRHLRTLQTRPDGTFRVRIRAGKRADWTSPARRRKLLRTWRVATAFYPGSPREWSMTAFDSLRPR